MDQALRRASGRIRSSSADTASAPSSFHLKKSVVDRSEPAASVPVDKVDGGSAAGPVFDGPSRIDSENVLEERDPQYDAMLSQMVGRIQSKPGGKLEMGEAFVVEKYKRPMPKLRNTTVESGGYEERPAPRGTLNVAQLRHIVLLHEGKADDHDGPMDVQHIAERFQIDVAQVQRILQSLSLPPEDRSKQKDDP